MKKIIFILAIVAASCSKQDTANKVAQTNETFEILSYKTTWHPNQSYYANIKYSYSIDTAGVDYIDITNNLRQGQSSSFRLYKPLPTRTVEAIDLAACNGCPTTYYCSIIMRDKSIRHLAEIRL